MCSLMMFLFLPQTIVNMRDIDSESDSPKHYQENGSDQNSPNNEEEDLLIHPDFRLWLTTQPEVGLPLPAVVVQHGLKLACEAQENFRDAVQTNCQVAAGSLNNSVPLWGETAEKSVFKVEYFFPFYTERKFLFTGTMTFDTLDSLVNDLDAFKV